MNKNKMNILIVDDEPLMTLFLKDIIIQANENIVGICHSCDCAIKHIKEKQIDIIFMDINIHGSLDGITVINKHLKDPDTIVFYISAYNDKDIIQEALSSKPYNYLIKPVREEDIHIALSVAKNTLHSKECSQKYSASKIYLAKNVHYDTKLKKLLKNNKEILLSPIEQKLINIFAKSINITISYQRLREYVWGEKEVAESTIRDTISKLRKKVSELKIETNFGQGYILKDYN